MSKDSEQYFDEHRRVLEGEIRIKGRTERRIVEIRKDPLFGLHSTLISKERADRPKRITENQEPRKLDPSRCPFCKDGGLYTETSEDRIFHRATTPPGYDLITFSNKYPFMIPHKVTVISEDMPELDLLNIQRETLERYVESCYEIAEDLERIDEINGEKITGMFDFINWGAKAGASIDHPHAQRGGLIDLIYTLADAEIEKCETIKLEHKPDPFRAYINAIEATKDRENSLYCFENDAVIVFCPFAPRFSDQVDIVYKYDLNSILQLNQKKLRILIAEAMTTVLHALGSFHKLPSGRERNRVIDVNVVLHQARFGDQRLYYRIHWHITPRMNVIGALESNYNAYVVDVYPETTAKDIRYLYSKFDKLD